MREWVLLNIFYCGLTKGNWINEENVQMKKTWATSSGKNLDVLQGINIQYTYKSSGGQATGFDVREDPAKRWWRWGSDEQLARRERRSRKTHPSRAKIEKIAKNATIAKNAKTVSKKRCGLKECSAMKYKVTTITLCDSSREPWLRRHPRRTWKLKATNDDEIHDDQTTTPARRTWKHKSHDAGLKRKGSTTIT